MPFVDKGLCVGGCFDLSGLRGLYCGSACFVRNRGRREHEKRGLRKVQNGIKFRFAERFGGLHEAPSMAVAHAKLGLTPVHKVAVPCDFFGVNQAVSDLDDVVVCALDGGFDCRRFGS